MATSKENQSFESLWDQKLHNFMDGYSHVLLMQDFYRQNGNSPFCIDIQQDDQTIQLVIDERFILAMNAGAERMYRELCSAGMKHRADDIMTGLRMYVENENGQ